MTLTITEEQKFMLSYAVKKNLEQYVQCEKEIAELKQTDENNPELSKEGKAYCLNEWNENLKFYHQQISELKKLREFLN